MKLLENKVAMVTGAAQGNGYGISKVMAEKGAKVIMTDKSDSVHEEAAKLADATGAEILSYTMDVTSADDVKRTVDEAEKTLGRIDILVNNAGISLLTEITEMDEVMRDKHFNVNINGAWNCVKSVLPGMMGRRYGRIVTISSVTGPVVCDPANIAYATSKAALLGFSKAIAIDTAEYNITSNAILPSGNIPAV